MLRFPKSFMNNLSPAARGWIRRVSRPSLGYLPIRPLKPLSANHGFDRGRPIDRFYIERFLTENAELIRGSCLEVKDNAYTRRFGGDRVTHADVLDIDRRNTRATIHSDLRKLEGIRNEVYDCVILTQVLQYIDDLHAALAELHRILKPGGSLCVTVPFLMNVDLAAIDFWRFTPNALEFLLGKHFPPEQVKAQSWGNMLTGLAFLMGMAQEDLRPKDFAHSDPAYACIVSARVTKPPRAT